MKTRVIRDYVYRTNVVGAGNVVSAPETYANLGRPGYEQLCGGMSAAYAWALNAVGIPARTVQLAAESYFTDAPDDTHVTVEALIDGEWIISDPTFNAEFSCSLSGTIVGVQAARQCVEAGGRLIPLEGNTILHGRSVGEYYLPYERLFAAYTIRPMSSASMSTPAIYFPYPTWEHPGG